MIRVVVTLWIIVAVAALADAALHAVGTLIVVVIAGSVGYAAGRRRPARSVTRKLRGNAAYGQHTVSPQAYTGGSYPPAPVSEMNAVSAYPPALTLTERQLTVRDATISGLVNLGWPRASLREPVTAAIAAMQTAGRPVTVQAVITQVLREAGSHKAERIDP